MAARRCSADEHARVRTAVQKVSQLERFLLRNVRVTGRKLDHGSYGVVEELDMCGLVCAGVKISESVVKANKGFENAIQRFAEECQLLSDMRHPHIVQFLGLCFTENSTFPTLVLEMLMKSLDDLLEGTPNIPLSLKRSMLADVAKGLLYLHKHNPAIVHRDLSARNVLVSSSFTAKITNLDKSRFVLLKPNELANTHHRGPGAMVHTPPEALYSPPGTDPIEHGDNVKFDIFSFGQLALYTATQISPSELLPGNYPDPQNPSILLHRSEVERRRSHFTELHKQLQQEHPLVQLITQCLDNDPAHRPSAEEVLQQLDGMEIEDPYQNLTKLEMIGQVRQKEEEVVKKVEEIRRRVVDIRRNCREIRQRNGIVKPKNGTVQDTAPQNEARKVPPHLLHPRAKLHWKKCADLPVEMCRPQCVVVEGRVYVGGGTTMNDDDYYRVFEYSPSGDEWCSLPDSTVAMFALGHFCGNLITVGGGGGDDVTGRVYRYSKESHQWREHLKPLPTARAYPSIITTKSAIVACGGGVKAYGEIEDCAVVEVYTTKTDQWHESESLPIPFMMMTSVTIADTCYLLGGDNDTYAKDTCTVLCASLSSLIDKAVSQPQQPNTSSKLDSRTSKSLWTTLPNSPLFGSAAASLGGCLLTVGGDTEEEDEAQSAIHVFFPPTDAWVRLTSGELPKPLSLLTTVQLSEMELFICGGVDGSEVTVKNAYIMSTTFKDD